VEMAEESENLKHRLLVLGQMAAGLAHEIRNPISSIGVHCSLLKGHLSKNEKLLSSVNMMAQEVDKVEYIIRECLNFVRPAELGLRQLDVDAVVESIVERFRTLYPEMEFKVKKQADASFQAEVDAGLFEQAINNIIANAVYACEENGYVEISFGISRHFSDLLRLGRRMDPIVHGHSGKEQEFVRITIHDNGPGIPPDIEEKIFVPFFTTKKAGTGLGLPLSQKIIHAHGGVLDLQSDPGKGTDFIIKIPVRQEWRTRS
jgi:two-component system sensor histidine kinase HydH